jgi:hypothetical protein
VPRMVGGRDSVAGVGVRGRLAEAAPSVQAANWRRVQADSVFIGVVHASSTFLPVFLLRLGASGNDVGLLTSLPALTAFVLAIPFGRMLQGRASIVPWYSRLRLLAWSSYAVIAAVAAVLPREQAIPVGLAVWALASLPSTAALVAFPMVMDGAAGPGGRFDLLGRRWAIAGVVGALAVAVGGQFLTALPFPLNYEILLVIVTLAGVGSYLQSSRIVIADQVVAPRPETLPPARERLRALWDLVVANRSFTRFELRAFVYTASIGISLPVLPLFYVQDLAASDAWIGIIAAAGSAGAVLGYLTARQLARRQSGEILLLPALFAMAATPAVLSVAGWLPIVTALAFIAGVAGAAAQLALFDGLMRRMPKEHGVTFSSVDQSIQNFAFVLAPNAGGFLAVAFGARIALLVVAAIGFAAFVLFAVDASIRRTRRAAARTAVEAPVEPRASGG